MVRVETHPGPHRLLVAFSWSLVQYLVFSIQAKCRPLWTHVEPHQLKHLCQHSREEHQPTCTARAFQMCWEYLHRPVLPFLGFVPLKGTGRNLPFIEHLLWARHCIHPLIQSSHSTGRWFIPPIRLSGKLRVKEIKLCCVLVRAHQRNRTNGIERKRKRERDTSDYISLSDRKMIGR